MGSLLGAAVGLLLGPDEGSVLGVGALVGVPLGCSDISGDGASLGRGAVGAEDSSIDSLRIRFASGTVLWAWTRLVHAIADASKNNLCSGILIVCCCTQKLEGVEPILFDCWDYFT